MSQTDLLSQLFDAERSLRAPAGAAERGLARLLANVAVQAAPVPVVAGALKLTTTAVSKWILAGFALGIVGSGAAATVLAPPRAASPAPREVRPVARQVPQQTAAEVTSRAPVAPAMSAEATPVPLASSARATAQAVDAPGARAADSSVDAARFDAELQLITAAKRELDAGHPELAQVWLTQHAERFPNGVFSSDREALKVLVACAQRRNPELAQRFAAQHPGSPMSARLSRACESSTAGASSNETRRVGEPMHD